MKRTRLMGEAELIEKGVKVLLKHMGPVEATRFLTTIKPRGGDSVRRHRAWQAGLNQEIFLNQVLGSRVTQDAGARSRKAS